MNTSPPNDAAARLPTLARLLQQDPRNLTLLADAVRTAFAAGRLDLAGEWVQAGRDLAPGSAAWDFKLAQVRIAERKLPEARDLLAVLRDADPGNLAVLHDLAYVALLEGRNQDCASLLSPWLESAPANSPEAAAMQSLWLRAMHRHGELEAARKRVRELQQANKLTPAAAGVASLIAVDGADLAEAAALSAIALREDPGHPEALLACASAKLASGDAAAARTCLDRALIGAAHQARVWSMLGFIDILELKVADARVHLQRAVELAPDDAASLQALGWACILQDDLPAAHAALQRAVAADESWGESHAALAVVLALSGDSAGARGCLERARQLQRGTAASRLAQAVLEGRTEGLAGLRRVGDEVIRSLAAGRRREGR